MRSAKFVCNHADIRRRSVIEPADTPIPIAAQCANNRRADRIFIGSWYYGTLGSSSGAAWAAASGIIGGMHGRSLAMGAGLNGWQSRAMTANGMAVSGGLNQANPWRR
jgi:hypothetical protein